jgi:hypothetical protein
MALNSEVLLNNDGSYTVHFNVSIYPLGFTTVFISQSSQKANLQPAELKKSNADIVVENENLRLIFDGTSNLLKSIQNKASGVVISVTQSYYYYISSNGTSYDQQESGAYIFRPNGTSPIGITPSNTPTIQVTRGKYVTEVKQTWSNWVYHVMRLYTGSHVVEMEATIGPIPIDDGNGKEVICRFDTNLATKGLYYTDANGLEMQQRKINYRPTWNYTVNEPVAGNYYPMNVAAFIKDDSAQTQLTILTDRSRGVASLKDGSLEMMVYRRLTQVNFSSDN